MNLRVDLILESEQRSGSPVSAKALLRIVCVLLPALLILAVAGAFRNMKQVTDELASLETQWEEVKPKQIEILSLNQEFQANRRAREELAAWQASRIDWHKQMVALMRVVPRDIQLRRLRANHALHLVEEKTPARVFSMSIEGRAFGEQAEQDVQALRRRLQDRPPLADLIDAVEVTKFAQDPSRDAQKNDRTFKIDCQFTPREFE